MNFNSYRREHIYLCVMTHWINFLITVAVSLNEMLQVNS